MKGLLLLLLSLPLFSSLYINSPFYKSAFSYTWECPLPLSEADCVTYAGYFSENLNYANMTAASGCLYDKEQGTFHWNMQSSMTVCEPYQCICKRHRINGTKYTYGRRKQLPFQNRSGHVAKEIVVKNDLITEKEIAVNTTLYTVNFEVPASSSEDRFFGKDDPEAITSYEFTYTRKLANGNELRPIDQTLYRNLNEAKRACSLDAANCRGINEKVVFGTIFYTRHKINSPQDVHAGIFGEESSFLRHRKLVPDSSYKLLYESSVEAAKQKCDNLNTCFSHGQENAVNNAFITTNLVYGIQQCDTENSCKASCAADENCEGYSSIKYADANEEWATTDVYSYSGYFCDDDLDCRVKCAMDVTCEGYTKRWRARGYESFSSQQNMHTMSQSECSLVAQNDFLWYDGHPKHSAAINDGNLDWYEKDRPLCNGWYAKNVYYQPNSCGSITAGTYPTCCLAEYQEYNPGRIDLGMYGCRIIGQIGNRECMPEIERKKVLWTLHYDGYRSQWSGNRYGYVGYGYGQSWSCTNLDWVRNDLYGHAGYDHTNLDEEQCYCAPDNSVNTVNGEISLNYRFEETIYKQIYYTYGVRSEGQPVGVTLSHPKTQNGRHFMFGTKQDGIFVNDVLEATKPVYVPQQSIFYEAPQTVMNSFYIQRNAGIELTPFISLFFKTFPDPRKALYEGSFTANSNTAFEDCSNNPSCDGINVLEILQPNRAVFLGLDTTLNVSLVFSDSDTDFKVAAKNTYHKTIADTFAFNTTAVNEQTWAMIPSFRDVTFKGRTLNVTSLSCSAFCAGYTFIDDQRDGCFCKNVVYSGDNINLVTSTECFEGFERTENGECRKCNDNQYLDANATCVDCPTGAFGIGAIGSENCLACPAGRYTVDTPAFCLKQFEHTCVSGKKLVSGWYEPCKCKWTHYGTQSCSVAADASGSYSLSRCGVDNPRTQVCCPDPSNSEAACKAYAIAKGYQYFTHDSTADKPCQVSNTYEVEDADSAVTCDALFEEQIFHNYTRDSCPFLWVEREVTCEACPVGKYMLNTSISFNSSDCLTCEVGKYSDQIASTECKECPLGHQYDITMCLDCPAGKYNNEHDDVCDECNVTQYQNETNQLGCKNCPSGKFVKIKRNTVTRKWEKYWVDAHNRVWGWVYYDDHIPPQYTGSPSISHCAYDLCPPGKKMVNGPYQSRYDPHPPQCVDCSAGTFLDVDQHILSTCKSCQYPFYQDEEGQATCDKRCGMGNKLTTNLDNCVQCEEGFYNDEEDQTQCKQCEGGYVNETRRTCEVCLPGTYTNVPSEPCVSCLDNSKNQHSHEILLSKQSSIFFDGFVCQDFAHCFAACEADVTCQGFSNWELFPRYEIKKSGTQESVTMTLEECQEWANSIPGGRYVSSGNWDNHPQGCIVYLQNGNPNYYHIYYSTRVGYACGSSSYACVVDTNTWNYGQVFPVNVSKTLHASYYYPTASLYENVSMALKDFFSGGVNCTACNVDESVKESSLSKDLEEKYFGKCESCNFNTGYYDAQSKLCVDCLDGTVAAPSNGFLDSNGSPIPASVQGLQTTQCVDCPAGMVGTKVDELCTLCKAWNWHYMDETGKTGCKSCSLGNFVDDLNKTTQCNPCPSGKYGRNPLDVACNNCPVGTETTGLVSSIDDCASCLPGKYNDVEGESCKNCSLSSFQTEFRSEQCTLCPTGKKSSNVVGAATEDEGCSLCLPGQYSDELGLLSCKSCVPGSITNTLSNPGATSCSLCDSGYFSKTSTDACTICPPGLFQNEEGKTQCKDCPLGRFHGDGVSDFIHMETACPKECPIGRFGFQEGQDFEDDACQDCVAGQYQEVEGSTQCNLCGRGKYSTLGKSTSETNCVNCPDGFASNSEGQSSIDTCEECVPGTYSTAGAATCTLCEVGRFQVSPQQTECEKCDVNFYQNLRGQTSCQPCAAGKYSDEKGLGACKPCASGKISTGVGECTACSFGKHSSTDATECIACVVGKYADEEGLASCKHCSAGKIGVATEQDFRYESSSCQNCAIGESTQGQTAQTTCYQCNVTKNEYNLEEGAAVCSKCSAGKVFDPNAVNVIDGGSGGLPGGNVVASGISGGCQACEPGRFAPGGDVGYDNGQCGQCAKGYYQNEEEASSCKPCNAGYYMSTEGSATPCTACQVGRYTSSTASETCLLCAAGSYNTEEGRATECRRCSQGSYQSEEGQTSCDLCPLGKVGRSNFKAIYDWRTSTGLIGRDVCEQAGDEYFLIRTFNSHGHHTGDRDGTWQGNGCGADRCWQECYHTWQGRECYWLCHCSNGPRYCHVKDGNIHYNNNVIHGWDCEFGCIRYDDPLTDISVCSFCPAGKEAGFVAGNTFHFRSSGSSSNTGLEACKELANNGGNEYSGSFQELSDSNTPAGCFRWWNLNTYDVRYNTNTNSGADCSAYSTFMADHGLPNPRPMVECVDVQMQSEESCFTCPEGKSSNGNGDRCT